MPQSYADRQAQAARLREWLKTDPPDELAAVARAAIAQDDSERKLREAVGESRTTRGRSWVQIGKVLGISRQAARQRFGLFT